MGLFKHHFLGLKILAVVSCLVLFFPQNIFAFSGSGSGTSGSPYLIGSCSQLQEITNALSSSYRLTQNIDCAGFSFTAIGSTGSPFTGTLDGQDHSISSLTISSGASYVALFTAAGNGATISKVHLVGGSITGVTYAASFIASLQGATSITDSSSSMNITAHATGGLVAVNQGNVTTTIARSAFTGNLTSSNSSYVGGIMAVELGGQLIVTDCYTSGTYSGLEYVGGLVGYGSTVTINNCYSTASLTGISGFSDVGGLIGAMLTGTITNSFAAGSLASYGSPFVGGVFGFADGNFSNVYFDITATGTSYCSGDGGTATCNGVNAGNSAPNYFKNNKTNAPLNAWNFSGVWKRTATYPVFGIDPGDSVVTVSSSSSPGPANPPSCGDSAPSAPPFLFQLDATHHQTTLSFTPNAQNVTQYFIAYGYSSGDMRFGTSFSQGASGGVQQYKINDLAPNTTYYFRVRAQNGCMAGDWGNEMRITTSQSSASSPKSVYYAK